MNYKSIEKSILGTILLEENMDYLDGLDLLPHHFSVKNHQIIFSNLLKLHKTNKPISTLSLIDVLQTDGNLEAIGGMSYLSSLITFVTTTSDIPYYVAKIKNFYNNKKISEELIAASKLLGTDNTNLFTQKLSDIQKIVNNVQNHNEIFCDFSQIETDFIQPTLRTGFLKLDKVTHGLEYGTLSILTGEPGSGKSTLINQIIANIISDDNAVFLYSGELPVHKLKTWFAHTVANESDLVDYVDEFGEVKQNPTQQFVEKLDIFTKNKVFLMRDLEQISTHNLYSSMCFLKREKNINCFIFDNLMTLTLNEFGGDVIVQQKEIIKELKKAAKDLNIVVILVAHPNKESRKSIEPSMFDVAGASEIVNLADYVFKIIQEENSSLFYVLKNRIEGVSHVFLRLFFDKRRRRFYTENGDELVQKYI